MLINKSIVGTDLNYQNIQKNNPLLNPQNLALIRIEELYEKCSDLFDKKFTSQIRSDFSACYAELYFAGTMRCSFGIKIEHLADAGPDFYLPEIFTYCEVTAFNDGDGERNSIPEFKEGISDNPERQILLRIINSFDTKSRKMKRDLEKGTIEANKPIVIVISAGGSSEPIPMNHEGSFPEIVKALLPVDDPIYWLNPKTGEIVSKQHCSRKMVEKIKKNDEVEEISKEAFLSEANSHISAVIYSWYSAFNAIEINDMGEDFFIIHNPRAKNPLEIDFFPKGVEYNIKENSAGFLINKIEK